MSNFARICAALSGILFGFEGFFILNIIGIGGIEIAFLRYLLATVFLGALVLILHEQIKIKDYKSLLALGILNAIWTPLFIIAIRSGAPLGDAAFLLDMGYVFSIFFSWIMLGEKPTRLDFGLILLAIFGAGLILKPFSAGINVAEILALIAGIIYGVGMVLTRKSQKVHSAATTTIIPFCIAALVLFGLSVPNFITPTVHNSIYIIGAGILCMAIPVFLLVFSLKQLKTFEAGVPALLEPIVAAIVGFLAFGQILDIYSIIGGAVILAAIAISSMRR